MGFSIILYVLAFVWHFTEVDSCAGASESGGKAGVSVEGIQKSLLEPLMAILVNFQKLALSQVSETRVTHMITGI